jgi:N utilization substance protein B
MPVRLETRQRALALQLLYAWDVAGHARDAAGRAEREALWHRLLGVVRPATAVAGRALDIAEAVGGNRAHFDAHIARAADRWRLDRLAVVDRNVLRLGVFELLEGFTPPKVVIDEAVQLAHWFGGAKSPGFVNGVLDRIARDLERL